MILGIEDIMIVIHFRKGRVVNCTSPFTVTVISKKDTRSESSKFSVGLVWPLGYGQLTPPLHNLYFIGLYILFTLDFTRKMYSMSLRFLRNWKIY